MAINSKSGSWLRAGRPATATFALQNREIFFRLRRGALAHQVAEREDERVRNRVDVAGSHLSSGHQAAFQQKVQVLRDVRLIGIEIFHQLRNGLLGSGQRLKNPQAKWFAKITKASRDQFKRSAGEGNLAHDCRISLHAHIFQSTTTQPTVTLAHIAGERTPQ